MHPHPLQNPCHCEGAQRPWQSASPSLKATAKLWLGDSFQRTPCAYKCLRRGYFLSPATESTQRTPPKPMVLDSLHGRGAGSVETFHPRELNGATPSRAFALSLRLSTATRSALVLPVQAGKIRGSTIRCDVGIAPYEILSPYAA